MPKKKIPPMWKHQRQTLNLGKKSDIIYDLSQAGCVNSQTEFLTPTGWKRIKDYIKGDLVAEFHPVTTQIKFIKPLEYVRKQCQYMWHFKPTRGMDMMLSPEHRVLHYPHTGHQDPYHNWQVCSANEFTKKSHSRRIAATFKVQQKGIELTDQELRLMVAVIADGYFGSQTTNHCVIRLKKSPKKIRLHKLLKETKTEYKHRHCNSAKGFEVFTFYAPRKDKIFTEYYWNCATAQLNIINEEAVLWDGSKGKTFSSFKKESADFVQYAMSSCGYATSLSTYTRDRTDENRGVMTEYVVIRRDSNTGLIGGIRLESIKKVRPTDGLKHCFTTYTSFWLARHNGYIFATGNTGKTRTHIEILKHRVPDTTLILAPKTLLETAWVADIRKFTSGLKTSVAWAENREEAFNTKADIYITNVDAVKWLAKQTKTWWKKHFGPNSNLIIDEVTYLKHANSQRSKAARKIVKYFKYRAGLTGTPSPNGVLDIFHQMLLLDDGERLGGSFYRYRSSVCTPEQVGPSIQHMRWEDKPGAAEAVSGLLSDISVRHELNKCLDIPPNHVYEHSFTLSARHMKLYKELEATSILELKAGKVSAINAAVLRTRLLQVASGATYGGIEGTNTDYHLLDTARYELILDLVQEVEHSIVFFLWRHQREELVKEAEKRKLKFAIIDGTIPAKKRIAIVAKYQLGRFDTLFLQPQSAAHGLTLTKGTRTIWSSPTYQPDFLEQGNARIHRGGQTKKTESILIHAQGTVESKVYSRLNEKNARMVNLLRILES